MKREKELARNTVIIFVGKICTQFLSFILLPLYTAVLSAKEYGIVDLYTTCQMLIICVIFAQIEQAVFRFIIDSREKQKEKETIISSTLIFCLVQIGVLFAIFQVVPRWIHIDYPGLLLLNTCGSVLVGILLQVARGLGDNKSYAKGSFVCSMVTLFSHVVFITKYQLGVAGVLLGSFCGYLSSVIYLSLKIGFFRYIRFSRITMNELKKMLRYSLPLVPNALSWWIVSVSDRLLVAWMLGSAMTGILSVSQKFSTVYSNMFTMFYMAWSESASVHLGAPDYDRFLTSVINHVFQLFACIATGIIAVMPFVFQLLVNEEYNQAYMQIPIYMGAAFFNVIQGLYSVVYIARKETGKLAKSTMLAAVINLTISLMLINHIGLYAVSTASLISYGVISIYRYYDVNKYVCLPLDKKAAGISAAMFLLVCTSYYMADMLLQAIVLILVFLYSLIQNRDILKQIVQHNRRQM